MTLYDSLSFSAGARRYIWWIPAVSLPGRRFGPCMQIVELTEDVRKLIKVYMYTLADAKDGGASSKWLPGVS
jgi:hypothetical protein